MLIIIIITLTIIIINDGNNNNNDNNNFYNNNNNIQCNNNLIINSAIIYTGTNDKKMFKIESLKVCCLHVQKIKVFFLLETGNMNNHKILHQLFKILKQSLSDLNQ